MQSTIRTGNMRTPIILDMSDTSSKIINAQSYNNSKYIYVIHTREREY